MSDEEHEATKYFKLIIKNQLGINLDRPTSIEQPQQPPEYTTEHPEPLKPPTSTEPPITEGHAEEAVGPPPIQIEVEAPAPVEPTPKEPSDVGGEIEQHAPLEAKEKFKEISMEAIAPDITDVTHAFMNEIRALKEFLLEKISTLEKRIEKIEKILPDIMSGRVTVVREGPSQPREHRFYTDEIDILLREGRSLLQNDEATLERLVKLEAIEWQLLKIYEKGDANIPDLDNLLNSLRMEINRLRRILIA